VIHEIKIEEMSKDREEEDESTHQDQQRYTFENDD